VDLTDWWLSEKLDGVRAYWDGRRFLSRQGNELHAPDWFAAGLPETPLDGELWLDRKAFQRTVSIVRRQDKSDHWKQIRYVVFDAPGLDEPFEARLEHVSATLGHIGSEYVSPLEHQRCRGLEHLREELERIEALGGEGLMVREPGSRYEAGRSTSLLKVKTFHDADAVVVGHAAGKGRHKGRLGALVVRLPDGTEFSVGTGFTDKQRDAPPSVGSTITFRYQELSDGGVPRFPSFVRLRTDVTADGPIMVVATPLTTERPAKKSNKAKAAKSKPAPAKSPPRSEEARYFEYEEGSSSKFWEITTDGTDVTVRYGRLGTDGQTRTKSFADEAAAAAHAEKLIAEKTDKGYVETEPPE
jgi:DNA ligase-1